MRTVFLTAVLAILAVPANAALPTGAPAPDFVTQGSLAGKPFRLHLKRQLAKGPVVLYFFPKAFTKGCTLEARAFSEAMADFKKAGAQVIGMSTDNAQTLARFSTEECRNAFPVATATPGIVTGYDVAWKEHPGMTTRTSYVIARNGKVAMVHDDLDYAQHVAKSLEAVRALSAKR
jgi:peroxiredoxin